MVKNDSVNSDHDYQTLQDDLQALSDWAAKWNMQFNHDKCKVLHLGKTNERHTYTLDNSDLEKTSAEKDLGVWIDEKLQFTAHVKNAVNKASRMMGLIKTVIKCKDEITIPRLFKSLVRPLLEYGNLIWCPRWKKDRIEVEKVQRRATKLIQSIKHLPYEERLRHLKLPILHHRRRRGDMIQVYKIMNHEFKVYKKKSVTSK